MKSQIKKLLIIQHESGTTPGSTLQWSGQHGFETAVWFPATDPRPPAIDAETGVIICGGSMDAFEEDKFPWLKTEKQFIRDLLKNNIKIFGLCLGAQLLAEILGGRVYLHHGWEIGFIEVTDSDGEKIKVFHWHHCTFELPPGAERVVSGDYCLNQAFKWGEQVVGTQFHPESTVEWIKTCTEGLRPHHQGNVQSQEQMLNSLFLQQDLQNWYFQQLSKLFLG
jgi:GMP synthase-like glutamine amidotransferase